MPYEIRVTLVALALACAAAFGMAAICPINLRLMQNCWGHACRCRRRSVHFRIGINASRVMSATRKRPDETPLVTPRRLASIRALFDFLRSPLFSASHHQPNSQHQLLHNHMRGKLAKSIATYGSKDADDLGKREKRSVTWRLLIVADQSAIRLSVAAAR